ncbi:Nostrin [Bienertia sinuspersici]
MGHLAKQCPNKVLVNREYYYTHLNKNMDELAIESTQNKQETLDDEDSDFWDNQLVCYPKHENKASIVRRNLMSMQEDVEDEQRSTIFHSKCLINGKVHSFIVDSGSCTNVYAMSLVDEHNLATQKHPNPYKLNWLHDDNGVLVRNRALITFQVGDYRDEAWCDVVPMNACSLLLGRPWQSHHNVMHNGKTYVYSVLHDDKRMLLHPLPPPKHKATYEKPSKEGGHVCFSSCHTELLDCASSKKERRLKALQIQKGSSFNKGDRVWLSFNAQKLHVDHKYDEPMDEGPFEIVDKVGYETFKVMLGKWCLCYLNVV